MKPTGWLKGASIVQGHAEGRIYGDTKNRWADGTVIRTSRILSGPDSIGVIRTLNSFYVLQP